MRGRPCGTAPSPQNACTCTHVCAVGAYVLQTQITLSGFVRVTLPALVYVHVTLLAVDQVRMRPPAPCHAMAAGGVSECDAVQRQGFGCQRLVPKESAPLRAVLQQQGPLMHRAFTAPKGRLTRGEAEESREKGLFARGATERGEAEESRGRDSLQGEQQRGETQRSQGGGTSCKGRNREGRSRGVKGEGLTARGDRGETQSRQGTPCKDSQLARDLFKQ